MRTYCIDRFMKPKKKLSSLLRKHKGEEGGGQPNAYSKAPIIRTRHWAVLSVHSMYCQLRVHACVIIIA